MFGSGNNRVLISYSLHTLKMYDSFFDELESYDHCWVMDGNCIINTKRSVEDVSKRLKKLVEPQDTVFVSMLGEQWTGFGLGFNCQMKDIQVET